MTVGKPDESLLILALRHQDGLEMPPKEKLPAAVVADFSKWITEGAYFPEGVASKAEKDWWELVDRNKILPAKEPIEQAVDHYVDAKLKADQVSPVAAADEYTFIRRVTLDLAGRTPTAYEVRAYVESTEPDKKAKLVDRLLDSDSFERQQVTEMLWLLNAGNPTLLYAREKVPRERRSKQHGGIQSPWCPAVVPPCVQRAATAALRGVRACGPWPRPT